MGKQTDKIHAPRKKIPDSKKELIVADYVSTQCFSTTAEKFGVSRQTVMRFVKEKDELVQRCTEKRKEVQESVIDHFLGMTPRIIEFLDKAMDEMLKRDKLEISTISQITTAVGTMLDKVTMMQDMKQVTTEEEDDPITKALKERAASIKGEDDADK